MAEQTIRTDFVGGPCDGQTKQVPVSEIATGTIICGGQDYTVQGVSPTRYRATWMPQALAEAKTSPLGGTPQFQLAWSGLMHTLAFKVPAYLKRERVASQRIRRAVR